MAAQGNPVINPVRADRRIRSVVSLCDKHGVACGSPGSMVAFMRAIHENKLLAMEFWRIVGSITDEECGSGSTETVNQLILEVIAKSVTDLDVAGVMAAGRGPGGALIELASMLAGEDVCSPVAEVQPVEAIESKDDVYGKGSVKDSVKDSGKESADALGQRATKAVKPIPIKAAGDGVYFKYSKFVHYGKDDVVEGIDKYSERFKDAGEAGDAKPRIDARDAWSGNGGETPVADNTDIKHAEFLKSGTESDVAKDTRSKATSYPTVPASLWQYEETFRQRLRVEREESWQTILEKFTVVVPAAPVPAVVKPVEVPPAPPPETGWIPTKMSTWILVILMLSTGMVSGLLLARGYGSLYWREFDYWMIRHRTSKHANAPNNVGVPNGALVASMKDNGGQYQPLQIPLI
jgi:hypothetical protein